MSTTTRETTEGTSPTFGTATPAFIDFGCGRGDSLRYGQSLFRGPGVGIDVSAERVATCRDAGLDVQQGDLLTFSARSVAPVSLAMDLMPELDSIASFETALINMLRACRDYAVVQHPCFDSAEALLRRGTVGRGHDDRSIRLRPRAVDYLNFVQRYQRRLDIVGFAAVGLGEARTEPVALAGLAGAYTVAPEAQEPTYRSLRVIIARKAAGRFRTALRRAGTGEALLYWAAPEAEQ